MAIDTLGVLTTADGSSRRRAHGSPDHGDHDDMGALEVALLRRSLAGLSNQIERCGHCARTMLIGERVYEYGSGEIRCALCRDGERQAPADSHTVHGPEFGHSIRVIDRRTPR
jgi:LSD1 subclass zinc finger protein